MGCGSGKCTCATTKAEFDKIVADYELTIKHLKSFCSCKYCRYSVFVRSCDESEVCENGHKDMIPCEKFEFELNSYVLKLENRSRQLICEVENLKDRIAELTTSTNDTTGDSK